MNDATNDDSKVNKTDGRMPVNFDQLRKKFDGKEIIILPRDPGKKPIMPEFVGEKMPEMVEPAKLNRHERRKRAKLARKEAAREKIKAKRQKEKSNEI